MKKIIHSTSSLKAELSSPSQFQLNHMTYVSQQPHSPCPTSHNVSQGFFGPGVLQRPRHNLFNYNHPQFWYKLIPKQWMLYYAATFLFKIYSLSVNESGVKDLSHQTCVKVKKHSTKTTFRGNNIIHIMSSEFICWWSVYGFKEYQTIWILFESSSRETKPCLKYDKYTRPV